MPLRNFVLLCCSSSYRFCCNSSKFPSSGSLSMETADLSAQERTAANCCHGAKCAKLAVPNSNSRNSHSGRLYEHFHICQAFSRGGRLDDDANARKKETLPTAKKIVVLQYRKSGTRCQNPILIYRSSSQQLPFIIPTPVPFGTGLPYADSKLYRLTITSSTTKIH